MFDKMKLTLKKSITFLKELHIAIECKKFIQFHRVKIILKYSKQLELMVVEYG